MIQLPKTHKINAKSECPQQKEQRALDLFRLITIDQLVLHPEFSLVLLADDDVAG
jgi:hypothetical protein